MSCWRSSWLLPLLLSACAPPPSPPVAPVAPVALAKATEHVERVDPLQAGFYGKKLAYRGILILGHATVLDESFFAAQAQLSRLLEHAPRIRENLEAARHELHVVGLRQFTSDLPEHRAGRGTKLETGELFDWHMIGGHIVGRFSSCTEAALLRVVGHRLFGNEVCAHELAHAVEMLGMGRALRLDVAARYRRSLATGHWAGEYAAKNEHEWFAEVTRYHFQPDGAALGFYDARLGRGRAWLCGYDPEACRFVDDLYAGRLNPGVASWAPLAPGSGSDEAKLRSVESKVPARVRVQNLTAARIRVVWLDFDGRRDSRLPFAAQPSAEPGVEVNLDTWATHPFVITDDAGAALCTIVAGEQDAVVEVKGACP